jgi:hypothetical protein
MVLFACGGGEDREKDLFSFSILLHVQISGCRLLALLKTFYSLKRNRFVSHDIRLRLKQKLCRIISHR